MAQEVAAAGDRAAEVSLLGMGELEERLRVARGRTATAVRASAVRAALAATRCVGLQERHATKLARMDRDLADVPDPIAPP